jgi:hypothetical protein
MRLPPLSVPTRIGAVAIMAVIAATGSSMAASAAVAAQPAHSQSGHPAQKPARHQSAGPSSKPSAYQSAKPSANQSAKPSASASASPPAKIVTALSIGVAKRPAPVPSASSSAAASPAPSASPARKHGITAVVFGRLFVPAANNQGVRGKVVWLLRQGANGHWFVAGRQFTGPRGGVAFVVHVFKTATFKLAFRGTPRFTAAISATTTIS